MDKERIDKIEAHFKSLQDQGKLSGDAILDVILAVDKKARQEMKEKFAKLINEI